MSESVTTNPVDYELLDPRVAKDPGPYFARLRSQCPVARTEMFGGFWLLSRYADVKAAAQTPAVFSSAKGVIVPPLEAPPVVCLEQDDPEHGAIRHQLQPWFSPPEMARLEESIRSIVTAQIDAVIADGQADVTDTLAIPVPVMTIAAMLGLPESDWEWFRARADGFQEASVAGDAAKSGEEIMAIMVYLAGQLEARRTDPTDDILSRILTLDVDGKSIEMESAISLAFLLLLAGFETTAGTISGLIYRVAGDPTLRDSLRMDPSLIEPAVEEALRLEAALMAMGRVTTTDAVVADVTVPAGDRACLLFGAANRDPEVFDDPETFRVDRESNRHLAFGAGVHRCLGAPLARLELRIVLQEVLARMPNLALVDDDRVDVTFTNSRGYRRLEVTW